MQAWWLRTDPEAASRRLSTDPSPSAALPLLEIRSGIPSSRRLAARPGSTEIHSRTAPGSVLIDDEPISIETLRENGVLFEQLPTEQERYQAPLDALARDRGYVTQDVVELSPATPNLDTICAKFIDEHLHTEDEVRFVLGGEGVFDIRARDDRWMRVEVEPGDLIVVPENRFHRFMLTEKRAIRCVRLFKDQSGWTPHYREVRA